MKITADQKMKIEKIAKKFHLKLALVFGSFASGKNREESDLDIAVLGSGKISFKKQINLISEFSRIFRRDVDLSILNSANPLLLFEASKKSILIFGSKEELAHFKLRAFNAYHDYAPYFEMERNLNKRLINAYVH
jgi:uncharacterized protein